ncbi:MAG: CocE/NonD family hydrolase [Archaeoglobaceae archaeon]
MNEDVRNPIIEWEHIWIPLSDGCRLAAKIWMPEDATNNPVPAILEYIPYRKRDFKAIRDAEIHRYFAQHGYACLRVDLRGSGESEGILKDEYLPQELQDGLEVLEWIADQPWCSGEVGMVGLSWGGFNSLQLASLNPPQLKAIITVCSSDDRYVDDVHYMGGCLLTDNLSWASTMFSYNSLPPDPLLVGDRWREMWLERLEEGGLWLKTWLEHQRRDDYWKHASVSENYEKINCPVFAVSGWADGYSNTVFRLMENLKVPRKGLIGGWGHKYPHMGGPSPAINFLDEALRWWDRWLKGVQKGVENEPRLRVWMQDSVSPLSARRPGRWVAEEEWPSPEIEWVDFELGHNSLGAGICEISSDFHIQIQSPLSVGLFAGKWYSYAESTDLPNDQREEDGGALLFDTSPLENDVEILGSPQVELTFSSDRPVAMIACRLSDVDPGSVSTRVTYGLLNLTHRHSHEHPEELEVNKKYGVTIPLNHVAQRFPAGNQIRLAVSTSYWPLAWPSPEPTRLTIYPTESKVSLPIRTLAERDEKLRDLGKPITADPPVTTLLAHSHREWTVIHNLATNEVKLKVTNNDARYRFEDHGLEISKETTEEYSYRNNNYDTVRGEVWSRRTLKRADWHIVRIIRTILTSDSTNFRLRATLDAYENDTRIFTRSWDESIPRNLI